MNNEEIKRIAEIAVLQRNGPYTTESNAMTGLVLIEELARAILADSPPLAPEPPAEERQMEVIHWQPDREEDAACGANPQHCRVSYYAVRVTCPGCLKVINGIRPPATESSPSQPSEGAKASGVSASQEAAELIKRMDKEVEEAVARASEPSEAAIAARAAIYCWQADGHGSLGRSQEESLIAAMSEAIDSQVQQAVELFGRVLHDRDDHVQSGIDAAVANYNCVVNLREAIRSAAPHNGKGVKNG